jgi:AraC-like DNA-binding protein
LSPLAARCRRFLERPTAQHTIDLWSRALGLSRRTFTRLFRRRTGVTFSAWQRRACLLSAVPRLLAGEAITTIAFDLDLSGPADRQQPERLSQGGILNLAVGDGSR